MLRKEVKTGEIEVAGRRYAVRYYEARTARGTRRYSCEVVLDDGDRIIVDDDSMPGLESKVERLAPATIDSRLLAGRTAAA